MASGWTRATAMAIQDDQFGVTARTAPTTPMKVVPVTVLGTAAAAGTALGSTTPASVTLAAATNADPPVSANSASVSVTAGASGTVVGLDLTDSAGTPIRKAFGPLGTSRAVVAADLLVFAIGAIAFQTTSP